MRVPFVDTKSQFDELSTELTTSVMEVLSSGAYVVGKHNQALEKEVAQMHGVAHAIAVNSGTDALRIMLDACGIGPGDEVITTAFTFVASVETIVQVGATPVFVDILPDTFDIDPGAIEAAITPRTKAIMPIHLYGQLADVRAIGKIAEKHGLTILEDAAQAIGSKHGGVYAGNFGRAAGISYYVTKNLGAAGDGGMILTNDPEIDAKSRSLRIHGMGRERYYYDAIGYTSRLDEIQAAILRVKLTRLGAWTDRRNDLAEIYFDLLSETGIVLPKTRDGNNHTWHQFTIRLANRDELQSHLKSCDVDSMIYYPIPLHLHKPYRKFGPGEGSLPQTELASREVLSLPIHQHLSNEQIEFAANEIVKFAKVGAAS